MTLRERFADWITGGALTRAQTCRIDALKTIGRMERAREEELRREVKAWNTREYALRAILTARNITEARKIAREVLGEGE